MIQAAITKKQYQDLFAAHEKEKQKKKIHHEGGITREEAQDLMRSRDQVVEPPVNDPPQSQLPASQPRQRAPQKCSNCGIETRLEVVSGSVVCPARGWITL
ncbi:hypothetical protein VTN96DRAFT_7980 [Rasamsonia emersonii]